MQSVSTFFKEEDDFLYKRAEQKTLAKALEEKKEMIRNFKTLGVSIEDIAKGSGFSIEEVEALYFHKPILNKPCNQ